MKTKNIDILIDTMAKGLTKGLKNGNLSDGDRNMVHIDYATDMTNTLAKLISARAQIRGNKKGD